MSMTITHDPFAHSRTHHSARTRPFKVEYKLEREGQRPEWVADTFSTVPIATAFAAAAVGMSIDGCAYAVVSNRRTGTVIDEYGWNGVER